MSSVDLGRARVFAALFRGRTDVVGLGSGGVSHREVASRTYLDHVKGTFGGDIGIFPMLDNNTVHFCAVDIDERDLELAKTIASLLPACAWIEESKSKGYHVWVFFSVPCPAWAARAVLRSACLAAGRRDLEIFPKQDELKPGMVGNYINLPLFGDSRPILGSSEVLDQVGKPWTIDGFLTCAVERRTDPAEWVRRARKAGGRPPEERAEASSFGERTKLHVCAEYIIEHREDNPLTPGHRATVLFNLAKMILNVEGYSEDEALYLVEAVNQASDPPVPSSEVERFIRNAARGGWTSTGCDDPVMAPYVSPECPIANG